MQAIVRSRPQLVLRLALVAAVIGGCWAINFAWWSLLPPPRTVELVIPAGTAGVVSAGEVVQAIPEELVLRRGDTLLIANDDLVPHEGLEEAALATWVTNRSSF